jgi:integrase
MPKYKHGSGSIYKRGKTWWITYYVNGKQVWESAKTKDKAEARKVLQAKMGQIAEGRYAGPETERLTFDDLAALLLTDYQVNGKKTMRETRVRLEKHLRPFFGGKKAHDITTADVQIFIAKRQAEGATNAEINRETAALKRAFNLALHAEKIIRKPHVPKLEENSPRQGFFEDWHLDALLSKLPDVLRPPITFAYWTGWRMYSEVLALTWDRIDLEAGAVRLYKGTTKNKDGRLFFLPPELQAVLEQQWAEHLAHYRDCPFVFHRNGQRIKDIRGSWQRACREAGLSGRIPHDFRRTAIRNMVRAGIPERVAMQMAGHKTRDVFDRYNIVSEGDLQEAARKLSQRFARQTMTKTMTIARTPEQIASFNSSEVPTIQ